ncbi:MotA/TolQ/ExbB proton channel family protein [Leptospira sarikeiensis]|uniref:MotA/TolQ/ExbB proton channel family protein n=1 Tax=Leptospira sarikeiensis TaxID=2484943 RepID=A0A4R9K5K8_9LEPT|nr:MotA/TolQ/ExbB proton channel family protein [Leptospira sarikeiensis]TGL60481.1 MotA/TolQ/ExbB proton channel family protein [Leptospira sarikeiensis]
MFDFVEIGELSVFILLGLASTLAIAVGIERWFVFSKREGKDPDSSFWGISEGLESGDTESVQRYAIESESNAYNGFGSYALKVFSSGTSSKKELLQSKIAEEKGLLERRLSILSTLGNNAPFLGLLGTVLGVIKAFHGLGTLGSSGAEVVMRSISTALLATAGGLALAIPVVILNNYFQRKKITILGNLEILSLKALGGFSNPNSNHHRSGSQTGSAVL